MYPTLRVPALFAALLLSSMAPAQPVGTLALTDAEKQAILDRNSEPSVDAARAGLPGSSQQRQVHGEVGTVIGSHGLRSEYGTVAVPLGSSAGAVVSVENSHSGGGR